MAPFYGWDPTASRLQSHCKEIIYFSSLSFQKSLIFIWSTSEGWKAESALEPPSGFELGTPGLGTQCLMSHITEHKNTNFLVLKIIELHHRVQIIVLCFGKCNAFFISHNGLFPTYQEIMISKYNSFFFLNRETKLYSYYH